MFGFTLVLSSLLGSATAITGTIGSTGSNKVETKTDMPIIGLFAQPTSSTNPDCGGDCQEIAASYVKYLEASGARVVPIDFHASESTLDHLFAGLNGFFFPGGGAPFPPAAQYIFDKTVAANDAGDFMPLWGTCMGFQWLLISQTRDVDVLDPNDGTQMDSYNYSIPLEFYPTAAKNSRMFGSAPESVMKILATENVTMNNHHYGIYTEHFQTTEKLTNFYDVLSVNSDRNGVEFISSMESKHYPIYGTQWHPEKNPFEWNKQANGAPYEAINHSPEAVYIAQYMSDFFVSETRKSTHTFADWEEEDSLLMSNYMPTRTYKDFTQTYFLHF